MRATVLNIVALAAVLAAVCAAQPAADAASMNNAGGGGLSGAKCTEVYFPGCVTCTPGFKACHTCGTNYNLAPSSDGGCTPCSASARAISGCVTYMPDCAGCAECAENYDVVLDANQQYKAVCRCKDSLVPTNCAVPNIAQCSSCAVCEVNYYNNAGTCNHCEATSGAIRGCQTYSANCSMCDRCDAARGYASDGYGGCVCDTNFHDVDGVCTPCTSIPGCQQYSNGCSACNACNATAGYVADTPNNDGIVTRCLFSATFEDFDIASISGGDSTCSANFTDNFIYRKVHWQRASASSHMKVVRSDSQCFVNAFCGASNSQLLEVSHYPARDRLPGITVSAPEGYYIDVQSFRTQTRDCDAYDEATGHEFRCLTNSGPVGRKINPIKTVSCNTFYPSTTEFWSPTGTAIPKNCDAVYIGVFRPPPVVYYPTNCYTMTVDNLVFDLRKK